MPLTGRSKTVAASLTPFQQILLGTDGTVTYILEAYAGEPIEVVKLSQLSDRSNAGDAHLAVGDDEKVLRRRVLLRGGRSKHNLLYAEAVVVVERVEGPFLDGLLETDKPIGTLLAESRMETFREILAVGREPAAASAPHFGIDPAAELVVRTYRILASRRPIILITEKFPTTFFRGLPD